MARDESQARERRERLREREAQKEGSEIECKTRGSRAALEPWACQRAVGAGENKNMHAGPQQRSKKSKRGRGRERKVLGRAGFCAAGAGPTDVGKKSVERGGLRKSHRRRCMTVANASKRQGNRDENIKQLNRPSRLRSRCCACMYMHM